MTIKIPPAITALAPDTEARIDALVEQARGRQAQELRRALEDTLRIVPRPLRGAVRKIVGA